MLLWNAWHLTRRVLFALFLLFEVYTGWRNYQDIASTPYTASDSIVEWEKRLVPLRNAMPFPAGVVGYVSDLGDVGFRYDDLDAQLEYTMTQFVMAPIVVAADSNRDWIIGNLTKEGYALWVQAHPGKFDIRHLGFGMYLIHRLPQ